MSSGESKYQIAILYSIDSVYFVLIIFVVFFLTIQECSYLFWKFLLNQLQTNIEYKSDFKIYHLLIIL